MQSHTSAAFPAFLPVCGEHSRLLENWTKALRYSCALRHQLCAKARLLPEELQAIQTQLEKARVQLRSCWSLLEQHRMQHKCNRSSSEQQPTAAFSCTAAQSFTPSSSNCSPAPIPPRRESAGQRRDHELQQLAKEGMPLVFHGRWHASIGPLHIWPHAGRWSNEATEKSGKINFLSMRALIGRELLESEKPPDKNKQRKSRAKSAL